MTIVKCTVYLCCFVQEQVPNDRRWEPSDGLCARLPINVELQRRSWGRFAQHECATDAPSYSESVRS